jgi:hypothetical protein
MPVTHIPQHELDAERRAAEKAPASMLAKTEMRGGDGVLSMRIPPKAFLNATVVQGHGLNDTEYWADMRRRHPEIVVKYQPRKMVFAPKSTVDLFQPEGRLTRFGRVTFSKRYA